MDLNYFTFRHPFTCMVSGPTSSGKTVLVRRILNSFKILINFCEKTGKLKILWAYGQWQPLYEQQISSDIEIRYIFGLPSEEEILEDKPHVIIIDDLMSEVGNNVNFTNLITKGSHHLNISVIFITQNLFHKGTQMRTVALNCNYYLIMKSIRGKSQLRHLARDSFPEKTAYLLEAYDDATADNPFTYLKIDMTQQTPEKYRVTTRITPEETPTNQYMPIVYIPR